MHVSFPRLVSEDLQMCRAAHIYYYTTMSGLCAARSIFVFFLCTGCCAGMCSGIPSSRGDAPPISPPPRALFISSVVFLSIFVVVFVALALCFCRRRARTGSELTARAVLAGEGGDQPFPVETLPAFAYACQQPEGVQGRTAAPECAVCLGAVREGEMVRRLPSCGHVYHVECIDRWLAAHRTCPLCRSKLDPCKMSSDALPPPQEAPVDYQLPV